MTSTLVFAGGGTGGHVYPMIAVADAVRELAPELELVFVGTERGMETRAVPERGYRLELMRVLPIRGGGVLGALRGIARAAMSVPEARALLRRLRPNAVFSIGGYAAGPVSLGARSLGIPLALMEPNSVIGLANRLIAPLVQRAYTAFPESERHFDPRRVLRAGVPIRAGFEPAPYMPRLDAPRVLVLGGSQGAKSLNEAVPRALAQLGQNVRVVHQCGAAHEADARRLYAGLGLEARAQVLPFIADMPRALADADLVIARSGASAVSEICAVGRPSLLVPYPFASGDHQRVNAESLVRAGAALCLPATEASAERLAREITELFDHSQRLCSMAERATALGRPAAARVIAEDFLGLAGMASSERRVAPSPASPVADPEARRAGSVAPKTMRSSISLREAV
ncbi:MAG TPA: undecaprenyldiphospho-muramoylpentapeptide beta-N-acetylglucosaminyltransferase [Polyangiaceae bacterium]|nr:undecaprenyldiphospho-muramoylpentapeptide beta-N-acetylglucosaminyltransferase [Polyangiaceae bacterium]